MTAVYDLPTLLIFILFVTIIPFLAVLGLFIFKSVDLEAVRCPEGNNGMIGVYVGISSVFLGVMISFLIITVWNLYTSTELSSQQEAQAIIILYQNVYALPNTKKIQLSIIRYLRYVINVEYPELKNGDVNLFGAQILGNIQKELYNYTPSNDREISLYDNCIQELNNIINLRVDRIHNASAGINNILWGVCIFDSIIIILVTWFLICNNVFHYVLVIIISMFISASLFLIYTFSYPFRGQNGLTPEPFKEALTAIRKYRNQF